MVVTNLTYSAGFNAVSNEQIGNDSLYFPTGGFSSASGGSGTTQATGARYVITATTYAYYQGMSYDTLTTPFSATLPATSMNVSYKLVGTDSMYFPNGGLLPTGITSTSQGEGAHFVINGDTLRLTVSGADTTTGQIQMGTGVITLVRQL